MPETTSPEPVALQRVIDVAYLRGGTNYSDLRGERTWTMIPYTLIGQAVEGPMAMQLRGGPVRHIPKGGGYVIPAGRLYQASLQPVGAGSRRFHWMHLRLRILGDIDISEVIEVDPALPPRIGRIVGHAAQAMARCDLEAAADPIHLAAELNYHMNAVIWHILKNCDVLPRAQQMFNLHNRLNPVLTAINEKFNHELTREQLAEYAGLSPSRFHAIFQEATGIAPMQYVQRLRLRRAQELLLATDLSIKQIADAIGFNDPFHFSRLFKRDAGVSPRAYRRNARQSLGLR